MTRYVRIVLGRKNDQAALGIAEGWVGTSWLQSVDLSGEFPENWREFNAKYRDVVKEVDDISTNIGAGLACGMTWSLGRGIHVGDRVVTKDTQGVFHVGEVSGDYEYHQGSPSPHRRPVVWFDTTFTMDDVSEELARTFGSRNTVVYLSQHAAELDALTGGEVRQIVTVADEDVESPLSFVLEQHLEDFLVSNWEHTDLGKKYDLLTIDGEMVAQQFPTDTGPIDILAQSKDGKELLVIELKRGRVSDRVVGQILRYMGSVNEMDETKTVRGIIIGTDDDQKFKRALSMTPNIDFYRYEVTFKLKQG
jgi:restriction system protein